MKRSGGKSARRTESPRPFRARATLGRLWRMLWLLLALGPLVALVGAVAVYSVDAPYGDEFWMTPMVQKYYEGTLTWHDLWVPHNEHRIVLPRVIFLLNAALTDWDVRWEMGLSILLAVGLWALLVYRSERTAAALGRVSPAWVPFFLALLVFSLSQQENWFWGFQVQIPLAVLTGVGAVFLLGQPGFSWGRWAGAVALGLASTYSFGVGMVVWPVGAVALALVGREEHRAWRSGLPTWLLVAAANAAWYLHDYPAVSAPAPTAETSPGDYLAFVGVYLGAPLWFYDVRNALLLGWGGLLLCAGLLWWLRGRQRVAGRVLVPWAMVGMYAVAAALVTALGRASLGVDKALAPRYITVSQVLWAVAIVLLGLVAAAPAGAGRPYRREARWIGCAAVLLMIGNLVANASWYGLPLAELHMAGVVQEMQAMERGDMAHAKRFFLGPEENTTRAWREFLVRRHLSLFRPEAEDYGPPEAPGGVEGRGAASLP